MKRRDKVTGDPDLMLKAGQLLGVPPREGKLNSRVKGLRVWPKCRRNRSPLLLQERVKQKGPANDIGRRTHTVGRPTFNSSTKPPPNLEKSAVESYPKRNSLDARTRQRN